MEICWVRLLFAFAFSRLVTDLVLRRRRLLTGLQKCNFVAADALWVRQPSISNFAVLLCFKRLEARIIVTQGGGAKGLFWTESRFELNVTFSYDSEVSVFIKYFQYTETTETSESHNSVF